MTGQPDEHIFKFLQAKFGIAETDDFDAKLYLCNGAFQFLPFDTFGRLLGCGLLPLWILVLVGGLVAIFINCCQVWSVDAETGKAQFGILTNQAPELGYNIIHSFVFFTLALSTLRMKYLWTPHAAILAACVALPGPWKRFNLGSVRFSVIFVGLLLTYSNTYQTYQTNISKESEFYDPDTVELMEWAAKQPKDTVFSGSMQLNAGVRLRKGLQMNLEGFQFRWLKIEGMYATFSISFDKSSWRALTNHPHYEDKLLRETTFDVYQMYAMRTPEEVLERLGKYGTTHILVENSICYQGGRKEDNCATPDLLDLANDHLESDRTTKKAGLPERFCHAIRESNNPSFEKYFKKVLENHTFRVYKLINNQKWDKVDRSKLVDYYY